MKLAYFAMLGIIADFAKTQLQMPRSYCIVLVATMFIISQLELYAIDNVHDLWKASALLGLAYGGMFSLFPTLVIEWFGLGELDICFSILLFEVILTLPPKRTSPRTGATCRWLL